MLFVRSAFIFALLAPLATAVEKGPDSGKFVGLTATVSHVDGGEVVDNQIVADALRDAFNKIHNGKNEKQVNRVFIEQAIAVPEKSHALAESHKVQDSLSYNPEHIKTYYLFRGFWDFGCWLCPDDDMIWPDDDNWKRRPRPAPVLDSVGGNPNQGPNKLRKNQNKHRAFEAEFCNELRKNGVAFKAAKDCQVSFQYSNSMQALLPREEELLQFGLEITTFSVLREGHADVTSTSAIIGQAIVDVYNDLNQDTQLLQANLINEMDIDDETSEDLVDRLHTFHITMQEGTRDVVSTHAGTHRLMEFLVCDKLRDSGLKGYAEIGDCRIVFDFRPSALVAKME